MAKSSNPGSRSNPIVTKVDKSAIRNPPPTSAKKSHRARKTTRRGK